MTGINVGSQKEAGIRGIRARCRAGAAFAIHRQQVTVIKCFFISSQATTKAQNRIKQSGGMLALLMLRPFENVLAMRGSGMLQARIREQRDGEIWSTVWEPSSSCSYLHTQRSPVLPGPSHLRQRHLTGTSEAWPECAEPHPSSGSEAGRRPISVR